MIFKCAQGIGPACMGWMVQFMTCPMHYLMRHRPKQIKYGRRSSPPCPGRSRHCRPSRPRVCLSCFDSIYILHRTNTLSRTPHPRTNPTPITPLHTTNTHIQNRRAGVPLGDLPAVPDPARDGGLDFPTLPRYLHGAPLREPLRGCVFLCFLGFGGRATYEDGM